MSAGQEARKALNALLTSAGWAVQDVKQADIHDSRGVALRKFRLKEGHGFADNLMYVDGKPAGVIRAKKVCVPLTAVKIQSAKYAQGLPDGPPAWIKSFLSVYESTGAETHFTDGLDPEPRARNAFACRHPKALVAWINPKPEQTVVSTVVGATPSAANEARPLLLKFLSRVCAMPPPLTEWYRAR